MKFEISHGFSADERSTVAALYWEAFAAKLGRVMGPEPKALQFLEAQLDPDFALVARNDAGTVIGVAGFKTSQGALIGGELSDLARTYGWLSTLWRAPILALVERDLADDILLMDGICVSSDARGLGLGTGLLRGIIEQARALNLGAVRLDVIDTNPRAKALYLRFGFKPVGEEHLGPLKWVFGFSSATKMLFTMNTDLPIQNGHTLKPPS